MKTMRELRAIVAEDNARYAELGELWGGLTAAEQETLIKWAREMTVAAAFTPDPFSRKV